MRRPLSAIPGQISRRNLLKVAAQGAMALTAGPVLAGYWDQRTISFVHTHTGEHLTATYFRNGRYDQAALLRVAYTLRDFHCGDVYNIDPMLLDALFDLQVRIGHDKPYQVISGYRSPKTNSDLRDHSKNVAEHSLHMKGMAIDIRVEGVSTKDLNVHARSMLRGGVGYYPNEHFVHVDTGRIRYW